MNCPFKAISAERRSLYYSVLTYCIDGFSVGYETKGVLENSTCMEERQGDTHDALQPLLYPSEPASSFVSHLIVHFILPEGIHWNQMSTEKNYMLFN